jgi:hypothetical protein
MTPQRFLAFLMPSREAALPAHDRALQVVVVEPSHLTRQGVCAKHVLDPIECGLRDQRLVAAGMLHTAVADHAVVVRPRTGPELRRLLSFIKTERVQFVIVHKVDRIARNRVGAVGTRHVVCAHAQVLLRGC